MRGGMPGDLLCKVVVETPVKLNDEQRDLLRQLQKSFDDSNSHNHSPKKTGFFDSVKSFFEDMKP